MPNDRILKILNSIRENRSLTPIENADSSTRLREDFGFDSFDLAELTVKIEDEFGVDVFEDGIVDTVGGLCAKIEKPR